MSVALSTESRNDLTARGYSRRQIGRIGALLGLGAAMAMAPGRNSRAEDLVADGVPPDNVQIDSNEWWTGPFPEAIAAGSAMVAQGNRYWPFHQRQNLIDGVAAVENLPADHIMAWPGSSDPLSRAIVTFCSPRRGLVTVDPTYEPAWETAEWLKIPLKKVPLQPGNGYRADVRAMLAADPHAGVYYICSPNNPTGTLTPLEDIEWLLANKPAGSIVLVDEAYIHFADAPSAASLVRAGRDIVVLRTFSKLFGMAGLRLGLSLARPDLHQKMLRYDWFNQSYMLPVVAVAAGIASVGQAARIAQRRKEMQAIQAATFSHLQKRNVAYIPSVANMFIIDWKKPAAPVREAFARQKIIIGRSWKIWPTCSRITVGSRSDMDKFCAALDRIIT
ncbi:pyridoxal phosphate-dependent aminotransferase [Komagataeibacter sp. FNDCR2]|uniref:pyridoxal phosphate-dependent aminotransferase n=1 Tax=Komagataeibacter sp. FNDCR2 TaxID=2878682 RepID=UPI001E36351A|nr:pyridoxal phosphate-dependent aminotransferase [Komagataeibacter sp. FNDCR2]MCE2575209.1 pyridoxal phosphate-dependent aminotransferase [Komagataeibacter sp. FNDCR2]